MKKLLFLCCAGVLCASDLIGVDSLFKQQSGIRSITSLSLLSTGNPNSYRIYPNISIEGADYVVEDTKVLSLRQTLIYTLIKDLDILTSFGGNYRREEVFDFNTFSYTGNNLFSFNSWWIGLMYSAPKVFDFVPQITVQTSIIEREKILDEKKNFYVHSQSFKASLRSYSDPIVYSVYASFDHNKQRKFDGGRIMYGNGISVGADASLILSPKFSFDVGLEQRIQTPQKVDGYQTTGWRSIPTLSLGMTYSLNSTSAFSISGMAGGSSSAPDSVFGISFWKKF